MDKFNWIKSQINEGEQAWEVCSRLNAEIEVDNPSSQKKIVPQVNIDDLWNIVPPSEAYKVLNGVIWDRIAKAIADKKYALIKKYVTALVAGNAISSGTAQKINDVLTITVADPEWLPKVITTPARLAGFDFVMVNEVQSVIDSMGNAN